MNHPTLLTTIESLREALGGGNFLLLLKMFVLLSLGALLLYLALRLFDYMAGGTGLLLLALAATVAFFCWAGEEEVRSWSGQDQVRGEMKYARHINGEKR